MARERRHPADEIGSQRTVKTALLKTKLRHSFPTHPDESKRNRVCRRVPSKSADRSRPGELRCSTGPRPRRSRLEILTRLKAGNEIIGSPAQMRGDEKVFPCRHGDHVCEAHLRIAPHIVRGWRTALRIFEQRQQTVLIDIHGVIAYAICRLPLGIGCRVRSPGIARETDARPPLRGIGRVPARFAEHNAASSERRGPGRIIIIRKNRPQPR